MGFGKSDRPDSLAGSRMTMDYLLGAFRDPPGSLRWIRPAPGCSRLNWLSEPPYPAIGLGGPDVALPIFPMTGAHVRATRATPSASECSGERRDPQERSGVRRPGACAQRRATGPLLEPLFRQPSTSGSYSKASEDGFLRSGWTLRTAPIEHASACRCACRASRDSVRNG